MFSQLKFFGFVFIFLSAAMLPAFVHASETDNDVELHRAKAQKYIDAKDWASAEGEAKDIVETRPYDVDGWLMYGIIEQRLEHNDEAITAFHKYLDLNPPKNKADAVRGKLADLEIRATKQKQEVQAEHEETYGPRSAGIFFAYAPVYNPSTSSVLGGNVTSNIQFGGEVDRVIFGLQYDSGTIPTLLAPNSAGNYVSASSAALTTYILFFEFNPILSEPFKESTGPFSFYIPIHVGLFENSVNVPSGAASGTYSNLGLELATGLGVEWYSRSPFKLGATALYHQGWGLSALTNSSSPSQNGLENNSGTIAYGGNVGFEFKLTATYLFGHEKTLAEKADAN